jgi:uncharacterized repeat protein (TIGR02543 family)
MRKKHWIVAVICVLILVTAIFVACRPIEIDLSNIRINDNLASLQPQVNTVFTGGTYEVTFSARPIGGNVRLALNGGGTNATLSGQTITVADTAESGATFELIFTHGNATTTLDFVIVGEVSITFNSNGGSAVAPIFATPNSQISEAQFDAIQPTRAGYSFGGWYTNAGLTNRAHIPFMLLSDITFFARWDAYVDIAFETGEGGSIAPFNVPVGTVITQADFTGARAIVPPAGKDFGGFFTTAGFAQEVTLPYIVTANSGTLFVLWSTPARETATVTIDFNIQGVDSTLIRSHYVGDAFTLPEFSVVAGDGVTNPHHTFGGWYLDGTLRQPGFVINSLAEAQTLTARWNLVSYDLTFVDEDNTTILRTMSLPALTTINASHFPSPEPSRPGHDFNWNINVLGTQLTANTTVRAVFTAHVYHTLTFNLGGGYSNGSSASIDVQIRQGTNVLLTDGVVPTVTRNYHRFTGWSPALPIMNMTANVTVTAQWVAQTTLTVVSAEVPIADWNLSADWDDYVLTADVGNITLPTPPSVVGIYSFSHFEINGNSYNAGETFNLQTPTTAIAVWEYATFTLTINDGVNAEQVETNIMAESYRNVPADLTGADRPGFDFDGWLFNGTLVAGGSPQQIVSDSTFTASWTQLISVTFASLDPNVTGIPSNRGPYRVDAGVIITQPATPTHDTPGSFTFAGWFFSSTERAGNAVTWPIEINGQIANVYIYAHWDGAATLTFDLAGGNIASDTSNVVLIRNTGDNFTIDLQNPVHPQGAYFRGWERLGAPAGTPLYERLDQFVVVSDATFVAFWEFRITFATGVGTPIEPIYVRAGDIVEISELPASTHGDVAYDLIWQKAGANATDFTASEHVTLTALWQEVTFTLTIEVQGQTDVTEQVRRGTQLTGAEAFLAGPPPPAGYRFDGWQIAGVAVTAIATHQMTAPATITATWWAVFEVEVVTHSTDWLPTTTTEDYDSTFTLVTIVYINSLETNVDRFFSHFRVSVVGQPGYQTYNAGQSFTVTGDMHVEAVWTYFATVQFLIDTGTTLIEPPAVMFFGTTSLRDTLATLLPTYNTLTFVRWIIDGVDEFDIDYIFTPTATTHIIQVRLEV